jgi:hypothetical protein
VKRVGIANVSRRAEEKEAEAAWHVACGFERWLGTAHAIDASGHAIGAGIKIV